MYFSAAKTKNKPFSRKYDGVCRWSRYDTFLMFDCMKCECSMSKVLFFCCFLAAKTKNKHFSHENDIFLTFDGKK